MVVMSPDFCLACGNYSEDRDEEAFIIGTNPIIYCSLCHIGVHMKCVGLESVPEDFICDKCKFLKRGFPFSPFFSHAQAATPATSTATSAPTSTAISTNAPLLRPALPRSPSLPTSTAISSSRALRSARSARSFCRRPKSTSSTRAFTRTPRPFSSPTAFLSCARKRPRGRRRGAW